MSDVSQWSTTAASNNSTPPDGFPENQAPSTVNDSAREVMAAIAKWYADLDGTLTSGGSGGAYTLTTNQTHAALADQSLAVFVANHANENGHTLNVDSLGAKNLIGGSIEANDIVVASYNATNDEYRIIGPTRPRLLTEQATTSGTSINFTSIDSSARRLTVMFDEISTNGTDNVILQLGDSGGVETTGYRASAANFTSSTQSATAKTDGFYVTAGLAAARLFSGSVILTLEDATNNVWCCQGMTSRDDGQIAFIVGRKALTATLDRIRLTTVNGTNTFDAGAINVMVD